MPRPCGNDGEALKPGKHRDMQVARAGARKLFNAASRKVFLEWFAATCNVKLSAERAGFNYKTAFRHRMNDERFREGWDRALEQGVARLKAKLLETRAREAPIGIDGDWDAPEMEDPDPGIAIQLLREHERRLAGVPKRGRAPKVASNDEVRAALTKRLKAFHARVRVSPDTGASSREGKEERATPQPPPARAEGGEEGAPLHDFVEGLGVASSFSLPASEDERG